MLIPHSFRTLTALAVACVLLAVAAASALGAPPDPLERGPYATERLDPFLGGLVNLQEANSSGGATTGVSSAVTLQIRGSAYYPTDRSTPSPVIVLVHGNHTACDSGTSPNCTVFKRNDRGYAYLADNLASHGYTVFSLDQDQLMAFQDSQAAGMHQRRLLIAAALDMVYRANEEALPDGDPNFNIGGRFVGKLDLSRIGLMGHSRGGDAVSSFINYNRVRPAPGRRYNLKGVIALAPVDYERTQPFGVPYMAISPLCDGDVSNVQAARLFERSQYALDGDPFAKIHLSIHGANHNWFNTVWTFDGDDSTAADVACAAPSSGSTTTIRLTGEATPWTGSLADPNRSYTSARRGDADPALMGDQQKVGLATMSSFFRYFVGGEAGFKPYLTGERSAEGAGEQLPASACPTSTSGTRMACRERVMASYFAGAEERMDVIVPDPDRPLSVSGVGTALVSRGLSNPYTADGTVQPVPATTATGLDWCNPEPNHFTPGNLGFPGIPTANKSCPLPPVAGLGGQQSTGASGFGTAREAAPVNRSYGAQLAVAWDDPVTATGAPASISTRIPAALGDVSGYRALALQAAVNYFDPRNPARTGDALWNPATLTQDFTIAITDADGDVGTVAAGDPRYGSALRPTVGSLTARVHVLLNEIRVPLSDFASQGVDLDSVRKVELLFGEAGKPATGSIQLADVRFQEATAAPAAPPSSDVEPIDLIAETPRGTAAELGRVISLDGPSEETCAGATPRVAILTRRTDGATVSLAGTSASACPGAPVASVQATITTAAAAGKARYVTARGTLSRPLPKGTARALVATGTTAWRLKLKGVKPGVYTVTVRALDTAGNAGTRTTRIVVR